ncbi:MAG: DUF2608 domain-containing protein [Rickettsiaceae bacterium]|nr:DUF2608 domain-containing protein [Rickettsiaceae bacterium]
MLFSFQCYAGSKFLLAGSTSQVASYLEYLPKDIVIFVDIDNTIITPLSKTFRSTAHNKLIDEIKQNKAKYKNYEAIISNWRLQRKVMLTDKDWPQILTDLKQRYDVYGLTKIDTGKFGNIESMEMWRYLELKDLGIEFTTNNTIPEETIQGSSFYRGIFITGENSKSATISHYAKYINLDNIVVIDDRKEHLDDIEKFCEANSIKFLGILFNGLEQYREEIDYNAAQFQKNYLIKNAKWLEDDEVIIEMQK